MNENLNDAEADMEVEGSLNITLDDYNFDDTSDNFVEYITTKYDVGESSKQAGNTSNPVSLTVQSNATSSSVPKDSHSSTTSVDPEFVLKSVKKLNELHEPSDAIPDRRMAVKTTVRSIWKQEYMQPLYNLVNITNVLVTHTFAFTKYILIQELQSDDGFDPKDFIKKDFFVEVFLSLIQAKVVSTSRLKDITKTYRQLILKYKEEYCTNARYTPIPLVHAQQIALYECTKIQTAYLNNLKAHFGNILRSFVNRLFNKDEKAKNLREKMKANGSTEEAIKSAIRKEVYQPCNQVKQAIIKKETPESGLLDTQSLKTLTMFYASYRENYSFQKNSIYYDVKARPENHFKAFFKLAVMLEAEK
ncbi:hypothetical protein MFLAVUS_000646 [Mucor flavus]|uniref:Uncharacterized protein n=1 Tax=Mucor flavus TaxID=439312 RepID=A0ABP9YKB4_9FUNG